MIDPYESLAEAIIFQAVKDYRKARKRLKKHPQNKDAKLMAGQIERFFCSSYFAALTALDGRILLQRLQEE